jgi:hypothetical protein
MGINIYLFDLEKGANWQATAEDVRRQAFFPVNDN